MSEYEHVEVRDFGRLFTPADRLHHILSTASLFGGMWLTLRTAEPISKTALLLVLVGLFLALYDLLFRTCYYWKTDSQGLAIHCLLRRNSIRWCDVTGAATSTEKHTLRTRSGGIVIPVFSSKLGKRLTISIRHHLDRHSIPNEIMLPVDIVESWQQLPEETPEVADWVNPHPPSTAPLPDWALRAGIAALCAILLFVTFGWSQAALILLFISLAAVAPAFVVWGLDQYDVLRTPREIRVRRDHIQVTTLRGTATLPWENVTSLDRHTLHYVLCGRRPGLRVDIPVAAGTLWLLISMIGHLRRFDRHQSIHVSSLINRAQSHEGRRLHPGLQAE